MNSKSITSVSAELSGTRGCSQARAPAPPNRRRAGPGNKRSANATGAGTAGRRVRHRCGWWFARTHRRAACRETASKMVSATRPMTRNVERAHALMHEDLIDDDLEEQRAKRGRKAEGRTMPPAPRPEAPVLVDAPRNQVMSNRRERSVSVTPAAPSARYCRPRSPPFGLRHGFRLRDRRPLHNQLVFNDLAENQETAVAQDSDCPAAA